MHACATSRGEGALGCPTAPVRHDFHPHLSSVRCGRTAGFLHFHVVISRGAHNPAAASSSSSSQAFVARRTRGRVRARLRSRDASGESPALSPAAVHSNFTQAHCPYGRSIPEPVTNEGYESI